jgi:hypothetical protein
LYIKWPSLKICQIRQSRQNAVTDSPDLPTFAKGHFWKNVTRIRHIRTSNLPFLRIWGKWPLLSLYTTNNEPFLPCKTQVEFLWGSNAQPFSQLGQNPTRLELLQGMCYLDKICPLSDLHLSTIFLNCFVWKDFK